MPERIFFRPFPGREIRDPLTGDLFPPAGAFTEHTFFIARRVREGVGEIVEPPRPRRSPPPFPLVADPAPAAPGGLPARRPARRRR